MEVAGGLFNRRHLAGDAAKHCVVFRLCVDQAGLNVSDYQVVHSSPCSSQSPPWQLEQAPTALLALTAVNVKSPKSMALPVVVIVM